jgi:hypothetical protein
MAFTLPDFNLTCDVYTGPWIGKVYRFSVLGNLAWGRRVTPAAFGNFHNDPQTCEQMTLLLPALTDIRYRANAPTNDILEIPSGSGRWYAAIAVDDLGKGFPNEHRGAVVMPVYEATDPAFFPGLFWPVPIP